MFKKKSPQTNPYQKSGSIISQKLKTPNSASKNHSIYSHNYNKHSINQQTPDYAKMSKNQLYQEEQDNDYIAENSYGSEQESTLSYNEYKDIVNNLLENGQRDQEWVKLPETLKLIIKALHLSMKAIENKLIENRQIINEQGIQTKDQFLQIDDIKKHLKRINSKLYNPTELHLTEDMLTPDQKYKQLPKSKTDLYFKGLDMIMIEEVKTITDAIISQKSAQIINQVNDLNHKLQQKIFDQISELKDHLSEEFTSKSQFEEKQSLLSSDLSKIQKNLRQRLTIVQEQIQHLNRQLINEKQAMCDFAHYVEQTFPPKALLQDLLKNGACQQTKARPFPQADPTVNPFLSRNKIDQIVKFHLQNCSFLKRKDFEEFRDKVHAQIINFPTVGQVESIVEKSTKTKLAKMEQMNQIYARNHTKDDEPTLQLKKFKQQSAKQAQVIKESPNLKKQKNQSFKTSQSRLDLSKGTKPQKHSKRASNYDQPQIESSPVGEHKISRSKTFKQSHAKQSPIETRQDYTKSLAKFEVKVNTTILNMKQKCEKIVEQKAHSVQNRVLKRLQAAEQEFCSVVEQNWKNMTEKNLKIQKAQKQNMQHLLNIFSLLNVVARYTTIVNCKAHECVKWDKEVFNAQSKAFYLNSEKSHLYVAAAGVYEVHVVLYTLYDPVVSFGIELNSEQIYCSSEKNRSQEASLQENETGKLSKKVKQSKLVRKGTHPSRGVEYFQTLLIPSKSHLVVRMIQEMNGQGLIEVRKL